MPIYYSLMRFVLQSLSIITRRARTRVTMRYVFSFLTFSHTEMNENRMKPSTPIIVFDVTSYESNIHVSIQTAYPIQFKCKCPATLRFKLQSACA